MLSDQFNVMYGGLSTVLGCLQHILERAMSMTPNLTPGFDQLEAAADDPIDLDESPYLYPADDKLPPHFYRALG
jgi:hypothetical protein